MSNEIDDEKMEPIKHILYAALWYIVSIASEDDIVRDLYRL